MKKILLTVILIFLTAIIASAQSRPAWTVKLPKAKNNTYIYVCANAIAGQERAARNQAIARIFQSTAMRLGVPFDSQKVFESVQQGTDFTILSRQYNLPIYMVCEYTERVGDNYKVYVLCQVAAVGNVSPQFDYAFNGCNDDHRYSTGSALLSSALLPGLGQIGKRHYGEGLATMIGEVALVGGAVTTYFMGKSELDKITSGLLNYDDYKSSEKKYNILNTTNHILWGAAAALYVFNLYRAAALHPNYKQIVYVESDIITIPYAILPTVGITLKF